MDHNEYVVYENRRAMIEYIITFSVPRDKSAPGKTVRVKKPYSYDDTGKKTAEKKSTIMMIQVRK